MRRPLAFLVALALVLGPPAEALTRAEWAARHHAINENGMYVLGGWAALNLAGSSVGMATTDGRSYRFHQMNVLWGGVNLAIAGYGFFSSRGERVDGISLREATASQRSTERIFWLNLGLDAAYLATGLLLREHALTRAAQGDLADRDRYGGWGDSLLVQGSFLLVFDLVMAILHLRNGNALDDSLALAPGPAGLALAF